MFYRSPYSVYGYRINLEFIVFNLFVFQLMHFDNQLSLIFKDLYSFFVETNLKQLKIWIILNMQIEIIIGTANYMHSVSEYVCVVVCELKVNNSHKTVLVSDLWIVSKENYQILILYTFNVNLNELFLFSF